MSILEFCRTYRISPRTVRTWAKTGRLKVLRDGAGRIRTIIDPGWPTFDESSDDPDLTMRFNTLKPAEVAALLNVHPATIRKMVHQGRLKPVYAGSQRRFSLAVVRRALAERMLGRKPRNRSEESKMMIKWARWRLGLNHGSESPRDRFGAGV